MSLPCLVNNPDFSNYCSFDKGTRCLAANDNGVFKEAGRIGERIGEFPAYADEVQLAAHCNSIGGVVVRGFVEFLDNETSCKGASGTWHKNDYNKYYEGFCNDAKQKDCNGYMYQTLCPQTCAKLSVAGGGKNNFHYMSTDLCLFKQEMSTIRAYHEQVREAEGVRGPMYARVVGQCAAMLKKDGIKLKAGDYDYRPFVDESGTKTGRTCEFHSDCATTVTGNNAVAHVAYAVKHQMCHLGIADEEGNRHFEPAAFKDKVGVCAKRDIILNNGCSDVQGEWTPLNPKCVAHNEKDSSNVWAKLKKRRTKKTKLDKNGWELHKDKDGRRDANKHVYCNTNSECTSGLFCFKESLNTRDVVLDAPSLWIDSLPTEHEQYVTMVMGKQCCQNIRCEEPYHKHGCYRMGNLQERHNKRADCEAVGGRFYDAAGYEWKGGKCIDENGSKADQCEGSWNNALGCVVNDVKTEEDCLHLRYPLVEKQCAYSVSTPVQQRSKKWPEWEGDDAYWKHACSGKLVKMDYRPKHNIIRKTAPCLWDLVDSYCTNSKKRIAEAGVAIGSTWMIASNPVVGMINDIANDEYTFDQTKKNKKMFNDITEPFSLKACYERRGCDVTCEDDKCEPTTPWKMPDAHGNTVYYSSKKDWPMAGYSEHFKSWNEHPNGFDEYTGFGDNTMIPRYESMGDDVLHGVDKTSFSPRGRMRVYYDARNSMGALSTQKETAQNWQAFWVAVELAMLVATSGGSAAKSTKGTKLLKQKKLLKKAMENQLSGKKIIKQQDKMKKLTNWQKMAKKKAKETQQKAQQKVIADRVATPRNMPGKVAMEGSGLGKKKVGSAYEKSGFNKKSDFAKETGGSTGGTSGSTTSTTTSGSTSGSTGGSTTAATSSGKTTTKPTTTTSTSTGRSGSTTSTTTGKTGTGKATDGTSGSTSGKATGGGLGKANVGPNREYDLAWKEILSGRKINKQGGLSPTYMEYIWSTRVGNAITGNSKIKTIDTAARDKRVCTDSSKPTWLGYNVRLSGDTVTVGVECGPKDTYGTACDDCVSLEKLNERCRIGCSDSSKTTKEECIEDSCSDSSKTTKDACTASNNTWGHSNAWIDKVWSFDLGMCVDKTWKCGFDIAIHDADEQHECVPRVCPKTATRLNNVASSTSTVNSLAKTASARTTYRNVFGVDYPVVPPEILPGRNLWGRDNLKNAAAKRWWLKRVHETQNPYNKVVDRIAPADLIIGDNAALDEKLDKANVLTFNYDPAKSFTYNLFNHQRLWRSYHDINDRQKRWYVTNNTSAKPKQTLDEILSENTIAWAEAEKAWKMIHLDNLPVDGHQHDSLNAEWVWDVLFQDYKKLADRLWKFDRDPNDVFVYATTSSDAVEKVYPSHPYSINSKQIRARNLHYASVDLTTAAGVGPKVGTLGTSLMTIASDMSIDLGGSFFPKLANKEDRNAQQTKGWGGGEKRCRTGLHCGNEFYGQNDDVLTKTHDTHYENEFRMWLNEFAKRIWRENTLRLRSTTVVGSFDKRTSYVKKDSHGNIVDEAAPFLGVDSCGFVRKHPDPIAVDYVCDPDFGEDCYCTRNSRKQPWRMRLHLTNDDNDWDKWKTLGEKSTERRNSRNALFTNPAKTKSAELECDVGYCLWRDDEKEPLADRMVKCMMGVGGTTGCALKSYWMYQKNGQGSTSRFDTESECDASREMYNQTVLKDEEITDCEEKSYCGAIKGTFKYKWRNKKACVETNIADAAVDAADAAADAEEECLKRGGYFERVTTHSSKDGETSYNECTLRKNNNIEKYQLSPKCLLTSDYKENDTWRTIKLDKPRCVRYFNKNRELTVKDLQNNNGYTETHATEDENCNAAKGTTKMSTPSCVDYKFKNGVVGIGEEAAQRYENRYLDDKEEYEKILAIRTHAQNILDQKLDLNVTKNTHEDGGVVGAQLRVVESSKLKSFVCPPGFEKKENSSDTSLVSDITCNDPMFGNCHRDTCCVRKKNHLADNQPEDPKEYPKEHMNDQSCKFKTCPEGKYVSEYMWNKNPVDKKLCCLPHRKCFYKDNDTTHIPSTTILGTKKLMLESVPHWTVDIAVGEFECREKSSCYDSTHDNEGTTTNVPDTKHTTEKECTSAGKKWYGTNVKLLRKKNQTPVRTEEKCTALGGDWKPSGFKIGDQVTDGNRILGKIFKIEQVGVNPNNKEHWFSDYEDKDSRARDYAANTYYCIADNNEHNIEEAGKFKAFSPADCVRQCSTATCKTANNTYHYEHDGKMYANKKSGSYKDVTEDTCLHVKNSATQITAADESNAREYEKSPITNTCSFTNEWGDNHYTAMCGNVPHVSMTACERSCNTTCSKITKKECANLGARGQIRYYDCMGSDAENRFCKFSNVCLEYEEGYAATDILQVVKLPVVKLPVVKLPEKCAKWSSSDWETQEAQCKTHDNKDVSLVEATDENDKKCVSFDNYFEKNKCLKKFCLKSNNIYSDSRTICLNSDQSINNTACSKNMKAENCKIACKAEEATTFQPEKKIVHHYYNTRFEGTTWDEGDYKKYLNKKDQANATFTPIINANLSNHRCALGSYINAASQSQRRTIDLSTAEKWNEKVKKVQKLVLAKKNALQHIQDDDPVYLGVCAGKCNPDHVDQQKTEGDPFINTATLSLINKYSHIYCKDALTIRSPATCNDDHGKGSWKREGVTSEEKMAVYESNKPLLAQAQKLQNDAQKILDNVELASLDFRILHRRCTDAEKADSCDTAFCSWQEFGACAGVGKTEAECNANGGSWNSPPFKCSAFEKKECAQKGCTWTSFCLNPDADTKDECEDKDSGWYEACSNK